MTETTDYKPKKLTLGGSKLSFNKPTSSSGINKGVVSSRFNTIVEVKTSKISVSNSPVGKINNLTNRDSDITSEDFNKRLGVLRKAAEDARAREPELKFNSLSKIAEINQAKLEESDKLEISKVEKIPEEVNNEGNSDTPNIENKANTAVAEVADLSYESEETIAKKKLSDTKVVPTKPKPDESRKLKKTDIFHMLDTDATDVPTKIRSLASIKRAREKERRKATPQRQDKIYREVIIPETITVVELSNRMTERGADVLRELMKLGIMATSSQLVDADTAEIIVEVFGHTAKRVQESDIENILINEDDNSENLSGRAPIVTVMGHVDHGKTSLLDALKSTDVVSTEAGGITQYIGAYKILLQDGRAITFIDTPGHEAFTEMRTRGAQVTDIVVLVVAADDGIKKQTIEAISHAKAAGVPIIVAINKIDKPDIDINRVKNELLNHELVSEDLGGDTIIVPVSALKRINLDKLEEAILLVAEMRDLKANATASASGTVIEARMDKGKGVIATILVRRGTLKVGDLIVAGSSYGRTRRMINDKGISITTAGP
ncbi:MAG: translation initiation factor IF-2, partial [Janthinobacterium lividum]